MKIKIYKSIITLLIFNLALNACSTRVKQTRTANFERIAFSQIDGWEDDSHSNALVSFNNSCKKILNLKPDSRISRATDLGGKAKDWQKPCMDAAKHKNPSDFEAKKFFEKWFTPYKIYNDSDHKGLLTGYYQIELKGSKNRTSKFKHPVYRKPSNLQQIKGSKSINHAAINNGALKGRGLEILYVDSPVRLYFMQVQGSGLIKLHEGGYVNLGFEDHNGYSFQGINNALKNKNLKFNDAVSMMDYLHKDVSTCKDIIEQDPSYVFFKPVEGIDSVGGHGVQLKPERSLAIDYQLYPYGIPVWVDAKLPENSIFKGREYKRLFIAQDTGGAIRGPIRGDVFFGRGSSAEKVASHFKAKTLFYMLFPKTVSVPASYSTK